MRALLLLPLLLSACTGASTSVGDDDDKNPSAKAVTLSLLAPEAGAEYAAEDAIPLHVEARRDGNPVAIDSATWSSGDWSANGKETEAVGLPSGAHTLTVEVTVAGETYTESVDITVAEPVQTLYVYAGTLTADVVLSTEDFGDFDDVCNAPIRFTLDSGTLTGGGQCLVFDDLGVEDPLVFTLEGNVRGGNVTGDLIVDADGTEQRTPFTGSGSAGGALSATFDNVFRDGGNSVRIAGEWAANVE